ncbi:MULTISPECIES: YqiA/YcfP family alpha/beta fold hydrolase [Pseudoalteromonas]|uniref:YqiA/YcfP family alpha/beta fold hydrolase n=1 Tax=Pseudoalteromonas TaxID=53246 RepID=UPI0015FA0077|nr:MULTISPECIES: YqiA/YcfP family alpha/beta fold hydrolase [Pseudoalteromonas]QMW13887.1 esterase YqiA [Pseudoalteromonas sp. MT33b]QPL42280.1 esterase YqiA [Pseudoalteromonas sp. A41-2]|tara:strand:+ start:209 stop:769 length:561 start_codon:yes stop_codon:yes gene_type:complete
MAKRVIYIHGFNSSEKSYKAVRFGEHMAQFDVDYQVPRLTHEPLHAMLQLEQLITADTVLLGSSLGGFYATYLSQRYGLPAVLINPAVRPFELLDNLLGPNYNPYQNVHYELDKRHMDALRSLYLAQIKTPSLLYLLQQTGDEVLPYQEAVKYYSQCKQRVEFGGDHSFIGFEQTFASIVDFLKIT